MPITSDCRRAPCGPDGSTRSWAAAVSSLHCSVRVRWGTVRLVGDLFELGDALMGCGELAFEADDTDRCRERHILVE